MEFCITRGTIVWLLPLKLKNMKKNFFIVVAVFSLSLISCSEENATASQMGVKQEVQKTKKMNVHKSGIVHRIFASQFRTTNTFYVRLKDGKMLEGTVGTGIESGMDQPEDFFFTQPGDTIFYNGDDVISVKFKD